MQIYTDSFIRPTIFGIKI